MDENTQRNAVKLDVEAVRQTDSAVAPPRESYRALPEYVEPVVVTASANGSGAAAVAESPVVASSSSAASNNGSTTTDEAIDAPPSSSTEEPPPPSPTTANMVRENSSDHIEDGAGDAMLAANEKEQLASTGANEVKFIAAEHKNGDAKIDIAMELEKSFTGMTKEELMRYANDPFWVRLRWIFFVLFWGLWIAMLVGAILIIIGAPKCAAPKALPWYKQGPLVRLPVDTTDALSAAQLLRLQQVGARGAIFTVPADDTYRIGKSPSVDERIAHLVRQLNEHSIAAIADVTANTVPKDDALFDEAISAAEPSPAARSAFVFANAPNQPNNWLALQSGAGSAWQPVGAGTGTWVLAQFAADRYDVQLNATVAKDRFKAVLRKLADFGVRGVRLLNAKHLIVSAELKDEVQAAAPSALHTEYGYWQHAQTTYQPGLGELLGEFADTVRNATDGEGFLSVADNIGPKPEVFRRRSADGQGTELAIELPTVGALPRTLAQPGTAATADQLLQELERAVRAVGNASWVQWQYDVEELATGAVGLSEYNAFVWLLPGVPVAPVEQFELDVVAAQAPVALDATTTTSTTTEAPAANGTATTVATPTTPAVAAAAQEQDTDLLAELEALRKTPSYQHGSFAVFTNTNKTVVAYSRIKSGNPGYFVAYNPTDAPVEANFAGVQHLPEQLTVLTYSANYRAANVVAKAKVPAAAIPLAPRSVVILTYVPKTSA